MTKPMLQAMVLADHVYRDAGSGKFIIAGTFCTLWHGQQQALPPDPARPSEIAGPRQTFAAPMTRVGSPYLYLALTGVHGRISLAMRYINLEDSNVLFEGQLDMTSSDPVSIAEYCFPLPMLPNNLGHFSLDVLYEGEILGSWRVAVKEHAKEDDTRH